MAKPGWNGRRAGGLQDAKRWRELAATTAPDSVRAWAQRYLEALLVAQYAQPTVWTRAQYLARFATWCEERALATPREVTRQVLERFAKHVFQQRRHDGAPLRASTQKVYLNTLRAFFRWLFLGQHIATNPGADLLVPRVPLRQLPQPLTVQEVELVLNTLDVTKPIELRDRAVWEVLYSTGLRRTEVVRLKLRDLDRAQGLLFVRQGKWRKDRVVPIGERALSWIDKYVEELRGTWATAASAEYLFLNPDGRPPTVGALTMRGRKLMTRAGLTKGGSCHVFRHSMATHMLEHGADVRYVQEMLGHASLATTQIYTAVSIGKLKAVHSATHPKARLARKDAPTQAAADAADRDDSADDSGAAPAA
jgi:integrase/recombinase XerD